jgi:hypothetical protein
MLLGKDFMKVLEKRHRAQNAPIEGNKDQASWSGLETLL